MSGPNTDYDPVEVTPLKAEEVEAMRDAALAAIAGAADLGALKQVRLEHAGDRSPLALANREIGALPPQARKEAGQRVGQARGRGQPGAGASGRPCSRPSTRSGCWSRRPSTSPCRPTACRAGARHPITTGSELIADIFVAMGWEVAEGPVIEAEWLNFDALNLGPDHPARTMQDTFWTEPADDHLVLRTHTSPVQARTMLDPHAADLRRLPGPGLPHRRVRRHAQPDVPPGRGPRRRRGHHHGPPQGHPRPLRHRACSATASPRGSGRRTSRSPSPAPRSTCVCFVCRGGRQRRRLPHLPGRGLDRVGRLRRGEPAGAHRLRRRLRALHRLRVRHGHRPDADVPARRSRTCARCFEGDVRFTTAFGTEI